MAVSSFLGRLPFGGRVSLVAATAGVAGLSAIANAIAVAAPAADPAPTRLGASIRQSVQERDEAMARQRRSLDMQEQALKASQARLKADMESRSAAAVPSPAESAAAERGDTPYDELARIYQTMKPARAAPIFERLDLDVQTAVARRMRERSSALIMASMTPDAAVRLSMALAGKRVEPALRPALAASAPKAAAVAKPAPAKAAPVRQPVKEAAQPKAAEQTPAKEPQKS